jgi:hypothetical protein
LLQNNPSNSDSAMEINALAQIVAVILFVFSLKQKDSSG